MLTKELTAADQAKVRKLVANSIRTDWEHYNQGTWISNDGSTSEQAILSKMKVTKLVEPDLLPTCGTTCCIAGRAAVVGVQLGLVKKPHANKVGIYTRTAKTFVQVADEGQKLLGVTDGAESWGIFGGSFEAISREENNRQADAEDEFAKLVGGDEPHTTAYPFARKMYAATRKENAARVARMIDELGETTESQQAAMKKRFRPTEGFDLEKIIGDVKAEIKASKTVTE